jgi:hypothetical protein
VALRAFPRGVYDHISKEVLTPFAKITGLLAAVEAHPGVAEWLAR